jgi:hypothetical protein
VQSSEALTVEPKHSRYRRSDNNCDQPARHVIDFSAEAIGQVVPGRGYRILDMKPGTFE